MVLSNYNTGWQKEFDRYPGIKLEYTPLDLMWKCANYSGSTEHYPHFFAKSGYFAFFLYDADKFWVYDIFRVQMVLNALNASNVRRAISEPKSIDEAIAFIEQMIDGGNVVWATYIEPILIYGIEGIKGKERIHWYNPNIAPDGSTWGRDELNGWWESQKDYGQHILISPARVMPGVNTEEEIATELIKLVVQNSQNNEMEIGDEKIAFGSSAYDKYITDLRNKDFDFLEKIGENQMQIRTAWFSFAIYSQWTQYFAAHSYFSNVAKVFPKKESKILQKSADHYADVFGHWLKWEKIIGRHPDENVFLQRIGSIDLRQKAADEVELAKKSLVAAIDAQKEFIDIAGISLDDDNDEKSENDSNK
ncbi:hypothetical protein J7L68_01835 [bacterium]|nr:hypothetical protein [bacterium]